MIERLIFANLGGKLSQDGDDAVGIGAGVDADVEGRDGEVAGQIGNRSNLAIGHDVDRSIIVAECGAAQGEVFNNTLKAGYLDDVPHVELVFKKNEDAVEDVLEDRLRTKADAETDNPRRGDEWTERDPDRAQELNGQIGNDEPVGRSADDAGGSAKLGSSLGVAHQAVGPATHSADEEYGDALKDERDNQRNDDFWQAILEEGDEVVVPTFFQAQESAFVLWESV